MKLQILSSTILATALSVKTTYHLSLDPLKSESPTVGTYYKPPASTVDVERVTGPEECNPYSEYFSQEACACFKQYECKINCNEPTPKLSPISVCECISQEAYDSIFVHDLGETCALEPEQLVIHSPIVEIPQVTSQEFEVVRVTGQDECDKGFNFQQDACACFSNIQCRIGCVGETPRNSPLTACECISEEDYQSIFNHDLGLTCGVEPVVVVNEPKPSNGPLDETDIDIILDPPRREVCFGSGCESEQEQELPSEFVIQDIQPLPPQDDQELEIVRVQAQKDCKPNFTFNQRACTCFSDIQTKIFCQPDTINNPITGIGCISVDQESKIYEHGLGDSCGSIEKIKEESDPISKPDQSETSTITSKPEVLAIERVLGQDQCPAGTTFSKRACACFSNIQTFIFCQSPEINDPITGVGCIGEEEQEMIFNHGLGENCGADTQMQESQPKPNEGQAEGPTDVLIPEFPPDLQSDNSKLDIVRVSSQEECKPEFTFNQRACACFSDFQAKILCLPNRIVNPLTGLGCISVDLESQIYEHGLGENCGTDTQVTNEMESPMKPDQFDSPIELEEAEQNQPEQEQQEMEQQSQPVIQRVTNQDQCDSGFTFNQGACACFSNISTLIFCQPPLINNPITGAGCIDEEEQDMIFNHGLGDNCGAAPKTQEPESDEIVRVPSKRQCGVTEVFSRRACACFPVKQCNRESPCPADTPFNNPLKGFGCECMDRSSYDKIYDHDLGPECSDSNYSIYQSLVEYYTPQESRTTTQTPFSISSTYSSDNSSN